MKFLSSGVRIAFLAICGFAMSPINVLAEGQLTLVNSNTQVAFKTYALKINEFRYEAGQIHDDMDVLRICEAVDNSRLVIIGMRGAAVFRDTVDFLFGTPVVATAFDAFFRRGGMVYFEPGSWDVYNAWAESTRKFFAARGVMPPDGSCYINPSKDRDVNMEEEKE